MIDITGGGFFLTDRDHGVDFDFWGTGRKIKISWTAANVQNGWLVLDRNLNGVIDSAKEMFGTATEQPLSSDPNGFLALAVFDDNHDGAIDAADSVFSKLRVWIDANHNGVSERDELRTLASAGIESLSLRYDESKKTDQFGNRFGYRATVDDTKHSRFGRFAYDVVLLTVR